VEEVDARAMKLAGEVAEAHRQLREVERPSYSGLGSRIEQLLRLAEEQASDVIAAASKDAEEMLAQSRVEAAQARAGAQNEATELTATAQRESAEVRRSATTEAEEIVATATRKAEEMLAIAEREAAKLRSVTEHETSEKRTRRTGVGPAAPTADGDPSCRPASSVNGTSCAAAKRGSASCARPRRHLRGGAGPGRADDLTWESKLARAREPSGWTPSGTSGRSRATQLVSG
jgi:vacuolar-type H+-ATPase subunit H